MKQVKDCLIRNSIIKQLSFNHLSTIIQPPFNNYSTTIPPPFNHLSTTFQPYSTTMRFEEILKGGDLRSIGKTNEVVGMVNNQKSFDELYQLLFHPDRKIVMRAADAIEKITLLLFEKLP